MVCVKKCNLQTLKATFEERFCELIFIVKGPRIGSFYAFNQSKLNSFHAMARPVSIQCLTRTSSNTCQSLWDLGWTQ
jgi:hypothetical protein